jgi:hypothetical protein
LFGSSLGSTLSLPLFNMACKLYNITFQIHESKIENLKEPADYRVSKSEACFKIRQVQFINKSIIIYYQTIQLYKTNKLIQNDPKNIDVYT